MKKIIIEMIFNDAEGLIQHSQETFHDTFKGEVDYLRGMLSDGRKRLRS